MLSELVIASTLLVNSLAVLNFKLSKSDGFESFEVVDDQYITIRERITRLLRSIRYFRVLIAFWNIFIIFLMFVFFSH